VGHIEPLVQRFIVPEAMGRAWLKHKVGLLEHIIPRLYPRQD
jgi:hypothetical protein